MGHIYLDGVLAYGEDRSTALWGETDEDRERWDMTHTVVAHPKLETDMADGDQEHDLGAGWTINLYDDGSACLAGPLDGVRQAFPLDPEQVKRLREICREENRS